MKRQKGLQMIYKPTGRMMIFMNLDSGVGNRIRGQYVVTVLYVIQF